MPHSFIPIMLNFTLHVCAKFSHGEHRCASWCWCSPTRHSFTSTSNFMTMIFNINKLLRHGNTHLYVSKGTPWRVLHAKFRYNVCSKYTYCRHCTRATRALYAWGITSLDTTKQLTLALAGASMALFCLFKSPPHCCKTGASSFEVGQQRNLL